jgi:hypothetical protein
MTTLNLSAYKGRTRGWDKNVVGSGASTLGWFVPRRNLERSVGPRVLMSRGTDSGPWGHYMRHRVLQEGPKACGGSQTFIIDLLDMSDMSPRSMFQMVVP